MTTETTASGAVGLGRGGRMSRKRKRDTVLRLLRGAGLPGSLRHPLIGRAPQEGDDDDRDDSFGRGWFGPGWADVAQTQARYGTAPAAGGWATRFAETPVNRACSAGG